MQAGQVQHSRCCFTVQVQEPSSVCVRSRPAGQHDGCPNLNQIRQFQHRLLVVQAVELIIDSRVIFQLKATDNNQDRGASLCLILWGVSSC